MYHVRGKTIKYWIRIIPEADHEALFYIEPPSSIGPAAGVWRCWWHVSRDQRSSMKPDVAAHSTAPYIDPCSPSNQNWQLFTSTSQHCHPRHHSVVNIVKSSYHLTCEPIIIVIPCHQPFGGIGRCPVSLHLSIAFAYSYSDVMFYLLPN